MLVASIDEKDPRSGSMQLLGVEERQNLKEMEDQLIDILMILDSTEDTLLLMLEKYREFCQEAKVVLEDGFDEGLDPIDCALQERKRDVHWNRRKVETLHTKIQGTTNLVSPHSIQALG